MAAGLILERGPLRALRPTYVSIAVLLTAAIAVAMGPSLPPSLSGLTVLGPYVVLLIAVAISLWFNRGRAFIALASMLVAYAAYTLTHDYAAGTFAERAVLTGIAVLVPLNVLVALAMPERGVSFHYNYRWLLLAIVEVLLVAWIASAGKTSWSGTSWYALLEHWLLRPPPVAGLIMFAIAFAAAAARSWMESDATELRPMAVGLGFALVAFMLACEFAKSGAAFGVYMSAGGVILLVTLLQESHRMAFNDTLTGLPGRRALEERLPGLGPLYTIAMIDVDHFKRFNDTHGHEIGDQVLKLVAARLGGVEGGGTAYRYGGEEFSVLFPNKRLDEALPHLEAMRAAIEAYRMAMRSADRPKDPETGSQLRRRERPENTLSVTVSIGAAQRDAVLTEPAMVLRAADKALYRAKQSGRNMVCS